MTKHGTETYIFIWFGQKLQKNNLKITVLLLYTSNWSLKSTPRTFKIYDAKNHTYECQFSIFSISN